MRMSKKYFVFLLLLVFSVIGVNGVKAQDDVVYSTDVTESGSSDLFELLERLSKYVDLAPQERVELLMQFVKTLQPSDSIPDVTVMIKDVEELYERKIDSSAYSYDSPEFVSDTAAFGQFYRAVKNGGEQSEMVEDDNVELPAAVVAMMEAALNDSSSCEPCSNSASTSGSTGAEQRMKCAPTINAALLILNAYFSCSPAQRGTFFDTYCTCWNCGNTDPCGTFQTDATNSCGDLAYKFAILYGNCSMTSGEATLQQRIPISFLIQMDLEKIMDR